MGKQGGVVPGPSLTPPALAARGDRRKQRRVDPSAQTSDALFFALLGLDGAGKSTVLARLKKDLGPAPKASWGFSVQTIGVRVGWRRMQATFYDVGGSAKIRNIWTNYLADVHGCFYVVDSADGNRLAESAEALRRIYMDSRLNGKPLVILANKQNLPGAEADLAKFASLLDVAKLCPAGEDSFLRERSASSITVGRHIMIQKCVAEKVGFWGRTCDSGIRKELHEIQHNRNWLGSERKRSSGYAWSSISVAPLSKAISRPRQGLEASIRRLAARPPLHREKHHFLQHKNPQRPRHSPPPKKRPSISYFCQRSHSARANHLSASVQTPQICWSQPPGTGKKVQS
ncbi:ADP-ribosylation factor family-domain-containing protein [Zopfochytrium polystomum]|nr:ADP-ribosylation factor family-domain-containing protein [Zopfochytrium polystomum]